MTTTVIGGSSSTVLTDGTEGKPELIFAACPIDYNPNTPFEWEVDCDYIDQPGNEMIAIATYGGRTYRVFVDNVQLHIGTPSAEDIEQDDIIGKQETIDPGESA